MTGSILWKEWKQQDPRGAQKQSRPSAYKETWSPCCLLRLPQPSQNLSYLELSGVHRAVRLWSKSSHFLYLHTLWPKYLALGHRESKSTSTVQVPPETNRCCVSPFLRICNHSVTFMVSCSTTAPASGNKDLAEVSRLWLLNWCGPHSPENRVKADMTTSLKCLWTLVQDFVAILVAASGRPTVPPSTQTQSDSPTHWRAYHIATSLWLNSPLGNSFIPSKAIPHNYITDTHRLDHWQPSTLPVSITVKETTLLCPLGI